MRYSKLFLHTLKETPADAELISHKFMLRSGMIRKLASGLYSYLPTGLRSIHKVMAIVREEMNAIDAQEVMLPMVQPAELWQESGRWDLYGKELLRLKDRHDKSFCLGPTHEEVITDIVRGFVRSYRELPVYLYQIHTKFRDEIRPRFGLMRSREFIMKDGYSFHVNDEDLDRTYQATYGAYNRIFERCGLDFRPVEADTGSIGGHASHEFMVMADAGEDAIACCTACSYAANVELAPCPLPDTASPATPEPLQEVPTPGKSSVEEVAAFLGKGPAQVLKTLIYMGEKGPVVALIRGDYSINEVKLQRHLGIDELRMATDEEVAAITGAPVGFAGPIGLRGSYTLAADHSVTTLQNFVAGANTFEKHLTGINWNRDLPLPATTDIRIITENDPCPKCGNPVEIRRGIEVGHVFKLGTKYSKALNACFTDDKGMEHPMIMGCYGIGIGRTVAACIEQNHDGNGIVFPVPVAPFSCLITLINPRDAQMTQTAEGIYNGLLRQGLDVLLDDRDERPGVKFKDADLIGIPVRIVVGKGAKDGMVEMSLRKNNEKLTVPVSSCIETTLRLLKS
ncbi:MAG: proline--tRNA ligase [Deltaproteobacteria bacterium]|jgi:prolyl-tRNA synthetase|nr:proline--tRNA ligase [Deltaproteobacteria bacterium]